MAETRGNFSLQVDPVGGEIRLVITPDGGPVVRVQLNRDQAMDLSFHLIEAVVAICAAQELPPPPGAS